MDKLIKVINKSKAALLICLCLKSLTGFSQQRWTAGKAVINEKNITRIKDTAQWLVLKTDAAPNPAAPDIVFEVKVPKAGIYEMITYATTTTALPELLKQGPVPTSLIKIQIDNQRPTNRIVFDSWNHALQTAGKFPLTGQSQKVKLWLPKGIRLGYIEWKAYQPPAIPAAAMNYTPAIVPPKTRPRLWVNEQTLPIVKARLHNGENQVAWESVKKQRSPLFLTPSIRRKKYFIMIP